ncbi:hypothetical protein [Mycoplasmopsis pulmonis]|uniref:hypothetical protein n=1 Tax=Mycoplasmopsis pulmonis TaxID=2107 RepID=UPI001004F031|nr:hypothetical protein [Mycoplasmopsis pulmonis]VEU68209.1 Uncharacterised protein [Mycoplasmopsis pulmonis]
MIRKRIFLHESDLESFNFSRLNKFQQLLKMANYLIIFVVTIYSLFFITDSFDNIYADPKKFELTKVFILELLQRSLHASFLVYFIATAFRKIYHNHRNFYIYILWFSIYIFSGIFILFSRNIPNFITLNEFVELGYIFYFVIYVIFLEILYSVYWLLYNRRVERDHLEAYKLKIVFLIVSMLYVLIFSSWINKSQITTDAKLVEEWLPFYQNRIQAFVEASSDEIVGLIFREIGYVIAYLILIFPFFFSLLLYSFKKPKRTKVSKNKKNLFQLNVSIIVLISTFLNYWIILFKNVNVSFLEINNLFLGLNVVFLLVFTFLILWNRLRLKSSIYFMFSVSFFIVVSFFTLIIFHISYDRENKISMFNILIFSFVLTILFLFILFSNYEMSTLQKMSFNLLLTSFSLLYIFMSVIHKLDLLVIIANFLDFYLLLYLLVGFAVMLNFFVFVFSFYKSLSTLKTEKKPWTFNKKNIFDYNKVFSLIKSLLKKKEKKDVQILKQQKIKAKKGN